jgi:hypothetical protein
LCLGTEVEMYEDQNTEFKAWHFNLYNIQRTITEIQPEISAFLNTQGGSIYIGNTHSFFSFNFQGITDQGVVEGFSCNRKLRDKISLEIDRIVFFYFFISYYFVGKSI